MILALLQKMRGNSNILVVGILSVFLLFSVFSSPVTIEGRGCGCVNKGGVCEVSNDSCGGSSPVCILRANNLCGCECRGVVNFDALEEITLKDAIAGEDLSAPIQQALPYVFAAAGTALLVFIIYAGYRMMLSRGDPKAMAAGRQALMYGILGIVIIIVAYWIVVVIGEFFGITPFNDVFTDT